MRVRVAVIGVLVVMGLAGCVAATDAAPTPLPTISPTPPPTISPTQSPTISPTPSASTTATLEVSIDDYQTQLDFRGSGVDFDSLDGNIRCGIWDAYGFYTADSITPTFVPYAGCRPYDYTYQTDPRSDPTGNVGCRGGEMRGDGNPEPVCGSGLEFVGEGPMEGPVGAIQPGQSISFAGFTCIAPDDGTIECSRDLDGTGFSIGRDAYRYF